MRDTVSWRMSSRWVCSEQSACSLRPRNLNSLLSMTLVLLSIWTVWVSDDSPKPAQNGEKNELKGGTKLPWERESERNRERERKRERDRERERNREREKERKRYIYRERNKEGKRECDILTLTNKHPLPTQTRHIRTPAVACTWKVNGILSFAQTRVYACVRSTFVDMHERTHSHTTCAMPCSLDSTCISPDDQAWKYTTENCILVSKEIVHQIPKKSSLIMIQKSLCHCLCYLCSLTVFVCLFVCVCVFCACKVVCMYVCVCLCVQAC